MTSILITGCGYFTKHFVRQLLGQPYERICIYSRDEWKQAQLRAALNDNAALRWFVGDVRDLARLKRAMRGVNVVVHGAALKRIEVGQYNPDEMVKTNTVGTMNVIEACLENGVTHATLLSTDKAYQPVSPYGQSKALAESLFIASNDVGGKGGTEFCVTRYGNVAGSTGSVIPTWREQLRRGLSIRITDPEATRFWMTPFEAVTMVLMAISKQSTGPSTARQRAASFHVGGPRSSNGRSHAYWARFRRRTASVGKTTREPERRAMQQGRASHVGRGAAGGVEKCGVIHSRSCAASRRRCASHTRSKVCGHDDELHSGDPDGMRL